MNNENSASGYLVVRVVTANGAIPVPGATVLISGYHAREVGAPEDIAPDDIVYALETDRNGLTQRVELASMPKANSMTPNDLPLNENNGDITQNNDKKPYIMYNIETTAQNYRPVRNIGVPIYPGVTSVQTVVLAPLEGAVPPPSGVVIYDESVPPNL